MYVDIDTARGDALDELRLLATNDVGASAGALSSCQSLREHLARMVGIPEKGVDGEAARVILAWVVEQVRAREPIETDRVTPCEWDAPLVIGALIDPFSPVPRSYRERLEAARCAVDDSRAWKDIKRYRALKESLKEHPENPGADFVRQFLGTVDRVLSDQDAPIQDLHIRLEHPERPGKSDIGDEESPVRPEEALDSDSSRAEVTTSNEPNSLSLASSVLRRSRQFSDDLGQLLRADDGSSLHVRRDIEDGLIERLLAVEQPAALIVKGAPGHGKSTLLWSISNQLSQYGKTPLLISANWLAGAGALAMSELVTALRAVENAVLLLDTADLLLHADDTRFALLDMLTLLTDERVPWVLTSRLEEAALLPRKVGRDVLLGAYGVDRELREAVSRLITQYCPQSLHPGSVGEIRDAVARDLPVAPICTSPLLLRLLFELAAPEFPTFQELDVTGLFLKYWIRRVEADLRAGVARPAGKEAQLDLSYRAGGFGLALLAEGKPEVSRDVMVGVAEDIATHWRKADAIGVGDGAEVLIRRGVLVYHHGDLGFLHQTLFEFAAAQGLIARGAEDEIPVIARRLQNDPTDLFVGAVYEQFLILLGRRKSASTSVSAATRALLHSEHATLRGIGLAVWAHHPHLIADHAELCQSLPAEELRRFTEIAPTVAHPNNRPLLSVLESFWLAGDRGSRILVAEILERLARRAPADVTPVVQRLNCVEYLVHEHLGGVRAQPTVADLVGHLASADPPFARQAINLIATEFRRNGVGWDALNRLLGVIARPEVWQHVGTEEFLGSLETWFDPPGSESPKEQTPAQQRAARRARRGNRAMRNSLGAVYAQSWRQLLDGSEPGGTAHQWTELVTAACTALEEDGQDVLTGAKTIGLALILREQTVPTLVGDSLQRLFAIESQNAQREIGKGLFPLLLATPSIARTLLVERFSSELDKFSSASTWPAVIRDCLMRDDVPADVTELILNASTVARRRSMWFDEERLLKLTPKAATAGVPEAITFLSEIADDPQQLSLNSQGLLLDTCGKVALGDPSLTPVVVGLALAKRRTAHLEQLANRPDAAAHLRAHRVALNLLIDQVMSGTAQDQAGAVRLWQALVRTGALRPDIQRIVDSYKSTTFPEVKAALLSLAATAVREDPAQGDVAVALFGTVLQLDRNEPPEIVPTSAGQQEQPQVLEAARRAWLDALAAQPQADPTSWAVVRALVFRPAFVARDEDKDNIAGIANVSQYITNLVVSGYVDEGIETLIDAIVALGSGPYRPKQQTNAGNRWIRAIDKVVEVSYPNQVRRLIARIPDFPSTLGQLVITTILRQDYLQFAADFDALLRGPLPDRTARHLRKHMQAQARQFGSKPFGEIIWMPAHFDG
ncbi:hypothetical protein [Nocardia barduliensis]|uniref:hypothetical protein n=1 Tax=Nocardia barduliensis TaxID=2736643 RepID=UPI001573AE8C|nr:hypothetical protein [Nocardia barduliensis]